MDLPGADPVNPLRTEEKPYDGTLVPGFGSTDVSDVCWVCPTVELTAANCAIGTPGHSWQMTVQSKSTWGKKMMRFAGKVMAATAVELMQDADLLERAKADHKARVGEGYIPPIPKGVVPRPMDSFVEK